MKASMGKGFATTAPTSAIGTEDPLAAGQAAAIIGQRIVPVEKAVPVQRFILAAAGTALRFEGKSSSGNSWAPAKKRNGRDMGRCCCRNEATRRVFFTALLTAVTAELTSERPKKEEARHRRHFDHTQTVNEPEFMISIRVKYGTYYDGTAARNTYACTGHCH